MVCRDAVTSEVLVGCMCVFREVMHSSFVLSGQRKESEKNWTNELKIIIYNL